MTLSQSKLYDQILIVADEQGELAAIEEMVKLHSDYSEKDIEVVLEKFLCLWKKDY